MKERILVISSANIDLSVKAKRFPSAGETLISDGDYAYLPGGKGANASRARLPRSERIRYFCVVSATIQTVAASALFMRGKGSTPALS